MSFYSGQNQLSLMIVDSFQYFLHDIVAELIFHHFLRKKKQTNVKVSYSIQDDKCIKAIRERGV